MPRIKVTKKNEVNKDIEPLIQCDYCGKFKKKSQFYTTYLPKYVKNGVLPYCKDCTKAMCINGRKGYEKSKILSYLKTVDIPYIHVIYQKAQENKNNVIGVYIRMMNLGQYRFMEWKDGDLDILLEEEKKKQEIEEKERKEKEEAERIEEEEKRRVEDNIKELEKTEQEKMKDFVITDEIKRLFGQGYSDSEYYQMWNKYQFLSQNYTIKTSMHTEALTTYIRYKVKEEMAIVNNKPSDAKIWGDLAMKQAERAKINPNQFSKADLQGGLSTIGEIAQAVEENIDIIPILPQFLYRPNDAVDFCIWNYINYARDLEGKPLVEYKDVYKFYDKMKEDYISNTGDPNGIFKNDPTVENREKVKKFITLPDEYYGDKGEG